MLIRRTITALIATAAIAATAACGGEQTSPPLTLTDYKGADWVTDGTVKPPKTAGRGDRITYPHTMDGAVMAAVDSQTMLDFAGDSEFGNITRDYFAVTPGLREYLDLRTKITNQGIDESQIPRIKGFRFTAYDDNTATVELFYEQADRSITGLIRHLVWLSDTWLIQLPASDSGQVQVKAYDSLPEDLNALPQT
ncbi:hypothetical protein AB0C65_35655 [Nocardia sp. NPDC048505]|uniref:hypothetical protein n=1 Tax=Nocardia sp. NPDC048505 TaxID=3155756 RepID=UPI0033F8BAA9